MKSTKNVVSDKHINSFELDTKCYGFDLFFGDSNDLDKFSDGLMVAWATHPSILGFSGEPKSITRTADDIGGVLTYIWEEPAVIKPIEALLKIRNFMTGHKKMESSFTGSELYMWLPTPNEINWESQVVA